mgnify:CR=1 FL=1
MSQDLPEIIERHLGKPPFLSDRYTPPAKVILPEAVYDRAEELGFSMAPYERGSSEPLSDNEIEIRYADLVDGRP